MLIPFLDFIGDISAWRISQGFTEHSWLSAVFLLPRDAGGVRQAPNALNCELNFDKIILKTSDTECFHNNILTFFRMKVVPKLLSRLNDFLTQNFKKA